MKRLRMLWKRLSMRPAEADLSEEVESHIAMQTDDNVRAGMPLAEARRAAVLKFGSLEDAKERYRDARGFPVFEAIQRDMRSAIRSFVRRPAFFASAVFSLALGIGSATAVFSVVDRILFRTLPYSDPDRLVSIGVVAPVIAPYDWLFAANYQEARNSERTPFEAMTSWIRVSDCDLAADTPLRISCAQVEGTFLPVLGVQPQLGRNFAPEEDREGGPTAALLSWRFWQSHYAGDPKIAGKTIVIDGVGANIVGVLPPAFEMPSGVSAEVLLPQRLRQAGQRQRVIRAIGRLRSGVTPQMAVAQLAAPFQRFVESAPPDFRKAVEMRLRVETLKDQQTREYRLASWVLLAAVMAVLLIACVNVSNLLLTEAASRRRELAVRAALGATRGRLVAQRLSEALLLALCGGVTGFGLASVLLEMATVLAPEGTFGLSEVPMDGRVFLFASCMSLISGGIVGLAASLETPRQEELTGGRVMGGRADSLKRWFIAAQVAMSVVLLSTAGLLIASLRNLQASPLGLAPENVITALFTLNAQRYSEASKQIAFMAEVKNRLGGLPGGVAVAVSDSLPPGGDPRSVPFVAMVRGGDRSAEGMGGNVVWRYVTPGYFRAMGIRIVQGREFNEEDARSSGQVMVVNRSLAARLFPAGDAVGQEAWNSVERSVVVGVAADVRNDGIAQTPQSEFYVVRRQSPEGIFNNQKPPYGWRRAVAILRTSLPTQTAADLIREEFRKLDPTLPVQLETMEQHVGGFLQRPRFTGWLLSTFAALALVLAAVGLYGVVSYTVAQRKREIGVRIALGATRTNIVCMTLRGAMLWVSAGAAAGILVSLATSRLLRGLLFQVEDRDPRILAAAITLLGIVALAASVIPARRAASVNPTSALRQD